jgi:hypothetical protein
MLLVLAAEIFYASRKSALTNVGFTQAFGVFQAYYTRTEAATEGIVCGDELKGRALISAIGSLSNGGIVAVFAVFYYPHLPSIGMHIKSLCSVGTACIVLGLATAAASRSVGTARTCSERTIADLS